MFFTIQKISLISPTGSLGDVKKTHRACTGSAFKNENKFELGLIFYILTKNNFLLKLSSILQCLQDLLVPQILRINLRSRATFQKKSLITFSHENKSNILYNSPPPSESLFKITKFKYA